MTERIIPLGAFKRILLLGALAGSLAGVMMAGVEMIYGWASPVHSVWDAPMAIWAYIGGLNHFGHPANHIGSIVLGIGGHMMNAIFVAIVFVALMRILKDPPGVVALVFGVAYGLGLWALQRYVTLPDQQTRGHALHDRQGQPAIGLVARPPGARDGHRLGVCAAARAVRRSPARASARDAGAAGQPKSGLTKRRGDRQVTFDRTIVREHQRRS